MGETEAPGPPQPMLLPFCCRRSMLCVCVCVRWERRKPMGSPKALGSRNSPDVVLVTSQWVASSIGSPGLAASFVIVACPWGRLERCGRRSSLGALWSSQIHGVAAIRSPELAGAHGVVARPWGRRGPCDRRRSPVALCLSPLGRRENKVRTLGLPEAPGAVQTHGVAEDHEVARRPEALCSSPALAVTDVVFVHGDSGGMLALRHRGPLSMRSPCLCNSCARSRDVNSVARRCFGQGSRAVIAHSRFEFRPYRAQFWPSRPYCRFDHHGASRVHP